jgi:hypothetical protein
MGKAIEKLIPGGDFRWGIGAGLADAESFFAPEDPSGGLLREKRKWLDAEPGLYLGLTPEASGMVSAAWELALQWGHVNEPVDGRTLENLARGWEPDLLLVSGEDMALVAGAVCFPSSWDLRRAIGKPLQEVHEVVPRLNAQVGGKVARFMTALQEGKSYGRINWSLTRTAERNYHPALGRKKLDAGVTLEELHLRIEHQMFCAAGDGVLMGLRIEPVPLVDLASHMETWEGLREKIRTMPRDVAEYKGMDTARAAILEVMGV